jgi:hypothetical protein
MLSQSYTRLVWPNPKAVYERDACLVSAHPHHGAKDSKDGVIAHTLTIAILLALRMSSCKRILCQLWATLVPARHLIVGLSSSASLGLDASTPVAAVEPAPDCECHLG